jgi:hypothetical protein
MKLFKYFSFAMMLTALFVACESEDVSTPDVRNPDVVLSSNVQFLSENGGSAQITATVAQGANDVIGINLLASGTAIGGGVDYTISEALISIPAGSLTGSVTINAVQDSLQEGNETIEIAVSSVTGATLGVSNIISLTIEDDDVAAQVQIVLNEICYDPSNNALDGDANGDGSYDQEEDTFVEFVNLSSQDLDMSGFQIFDSTALGTGIPRHVFPANTIVSSGRAIVVFGGGIITGSFGDAIVQTSSTGNMNLNNDGDLMILSDASGVEIIRFDIEPLSNNPNESYTRNPDITGDFEQHGDNTSILFSPGTKIDGSQF